MPPASERLHHHTLKENFHGIRKSRTVPRHHRAQCAGAATSQRSGEKGRGPVLHLFAAGNRPCRRSHSGFAVRHEKRFHPGGGNHAPPLPLPADQEQFRFRAPRQLSLSRRLGHRGGGHHLRRQEKDVRTAGRLQAGRTAPASADSGRGRQGLLARPVRQARREAGKGFRRFHHHGRSAGCRPADQPAPPSPQGCP